MTQLTNKINNLPISQFNIPLFYKLHSISCFPRRTTLTRHTNNSDAQQNSIIIMSNINNDSLSTLRLTISGIHCTAFFLWQVNSHFQIEFSTEFNLVFPLPYSSIYTFTHSIFRRKTAQLHLTKDDKSSSIVEEIFPFFWMCG